MEAHGYYGSDAIAELSFSAGELPAAGPVTPAVREVEVEAWSEDQDHGWGCCAPVRQVTFHVRAPAADPWSYVALEGVWQDGQLATEDVWRTLDAAAGTEVALSYPQWFTNGVLWPSCFVVRPVGSGGEPGGGDEFCPSRYAVGTYCADAPEMDPGRPGDGDGSSPPSEGDDGRTRTEATPANRAFGAGGSRSRLAGGTESSAHLVSPPSSAARITGCRGMPPGR